MKKNLISSWIFLIYLKFFVLYMYPKPIPINPIAYVGYYALCSIGCYRAYAACQISFSSWNSRASSELLSNPWVEDTFTLLFCDFIVHMDVINDLPKRKKKIKSVFNLTCEYIFNKFRSGQGHVESLSKYCNKLLITGRKKLQYVLVLLCCILNFLTPACTGLPPFCWWRLRVLVVWSVTHSTP